MSQTIVGNLAVELGISDQQLQAGLAQAVTQAQQAGQKMANAMNQGTKQGGGLAGSAQGLLNISRAIDDVQYGFRGVINNIEGIVTGLGFSAGIAGAATIAAVALNALVPKMLELVSARDPMRELADAIRSIQGTGISGTFAGMAAEAKATQAALEASVAVLERMQIRQMTIPFATGGPGMAAPAAMVNEGRDARDIFAQRVRVNELAQEAARDAFRANQQRQRIAMGGLAGLDRTTEQQEQIKLNQQLFQAAVDKFGGGQQLADALKIKNLGGPEMFGAFKEGDISATNKAVELLGLQAELTKVMADDFERMTGSADELRRIEEQAAKTKEETAKFIEQEQRWLERSIELDQQRERIRQGRILDRQFGEYERAVGRQDDLFRQRDDILLQRSRSEILGSAAEVFSRNINAGQEDPQLKKLDEIKEEIKNLGTLTGLG